MEYAKHNLNVKVASMKRHWLTNPTVLTGSKLGRLSWSLEYLVS